MKEGWIEIKLRGEVIAMVDPHKVSSLARVPCQYATLEDCFLEVTIGSDDPQLLRTFFKSRFGLMPSVDHEVKQ